MNDTHITSRKVAIFAGAGLAGAIVGSVLAKFAVSEFAGSPPWELPAIIVGALAALIVTALIVPTFIQGRRSAKHKAQAPR